MKKVRVLHIEDNKNYAEALSNLLEKYDIINVSTGSKAIEILKNENDFQIIICDCKLPDILGFDLIKKIKEITNIPIIANSSDIENCKKMVCYGANIFLEKIFNDYKHDIEIWINVIDNLTN